MRNLYLLESLNLSHNKLQELQSSDFLQFPFLMHLDLSHNLLTSLPEAVAATTNLTYLNIGYNQISALEETFFSRLVNLTTAILSNNPITSLPASVAEATELTVLEVRQVSAVSLCTKTCDLQLRDTKLTAIPDLPSNITSLVITGGQLGEPNESVGLLSDLTECNLSHCGISSIGYPLLYLFAAQCSQWYVGSSLLDGSTFERFC